MHKYVTGSAKDLKQALNPFYLAAPFFNEPQKLLVEQIEKTFEECERQLFSPVQQHGNSKPKIENAEQANVVFSENYYAINRCVGMIAVVDWLLPEGHHLRLTEQVEEIDTMRPAAYGPPIRIPDSGTVWEMGVAYAMQKPVYLFTTQNPKNSKLNIMLTQSCVGVLWGVSGLKNFLQLGECGKWEGGLQ